MQKRFFFPPAVIVFLFLYFTVFGERGLLRINRLHRDRDEMQQRFLELKSENDKLKREITALQSDRRYLESIARRDFGLVRSNEVIYQFPPQDKAALGEKTAQKGAAHPGKTPEIAADPHPGAKPEKAAVTGK